MLIRSSRFALAVLLAGFAALPLSAQRSVIPSGSPIPQNTRQLLVVTTGAWSSISGTLRRFERDASASSQWRAVGEPFQIVVGRSGLGWGKGLHVPRSTGPQKHEGDGRAPAGAFLLTSAFGYDDEVNTGLPYLRSTETTDCVDDSESPLYNQVLDGAKVSASYASHEEMRRADDQYKVGIIVAHNGSGLYGTEGRPEPVMGGGSCIFLHVWAGPESATSGCTAMPEERLRDILAWLVESENPVLVQLTRRETMRLMRPWGIPGPAW